MPDYTKNMEAAFKTFKHNPSAASWRVLTVAMFAHQQAKHCSRREGATLHSLVVDVSDTTPEQINAAYEAILEL
ncbi:MAG: hypothetical protein ACK5PF_07230 [bacterium]|jgi:hypothetical protein